VPERRDSALIDAAIDAATVTDDFVRGVLQNMSGTAGGSEHVDRGWRRLLQLGGGRFSGERAVVRGFGAQYAPEQLRKAGDAAQDVVDAVAALVDAWTPSAVEATTQLAALALDELPGLLRDGDVIHAREAHERLSRAVAILNGARTRTILHEMRTARDPGAHPSA
jgi:hypothetical protein